MSEFQRFDAKCSKVTKALDSIRDASSVTSATPDVTKGAYLIAIQNVQTSAM